MLMAVMMSPREKWTDERLDDLNEKVDKGFARMDRRFESLEAHMDSRFESLEARFGALNRTLIAGAVAIVIAMIGSQAF
jgi:hypothetical protein